jgi:hypothetical protein
VTTAAPVVGDGAVLPPVELALVCDGAVVPPVEPVFVADVVAGPTLSVAVDVVSSSSLQAVTSTSNPAATAHGQRGPVFT